MASWIQSGIVSISDIESMPSVYQDARYIYIYIEAQRVHGDGGWR